ncbi:defect in organelle trafficking protein DotC [Piscirickettsia salmonis]|uniref:Type IV secretion system protein DotC n=1 Tax=Piscirickettsia salmonis TaxID=1238 RepID=A0A1L6TEM5_PISSA|nr:type IV secretory system conjugative DNA transfer family protein [Piscirickettsia salmonis]AKP72651.1 type IV secretion system protein DotC [Piscirickettsia salmonis LF-89 = ATCC VR-1361]ALB23857.1 type IV secretion system protein DotC [Piscirickettsia salmonis]ALY03696.1 type IV secretion system protein DotC [Piscirickettsia salmonis]AMA43259.1 type IV secretion system protein DotC [Piscirickettsia salmonis]AOS35729.1 type IV secretion system protein DotC [Piscirickettsia salmonis]
MIEHALYTLNQISNLSSESAHYQQQQTLNIRLRAVKQEALALGAQSALAYEAKNIDALLSSYSRYLYQIFDFNQLLLEKNVLPPVISDTDNSLAISGNAQLLRAAGRTYKIIVKAHFVTAPPTWRNYLYMDYTQPDLPNKILLPKNGQEKLLWKKYTVEGWKQGIYQAVNIYKINLNKLVRDFNGMILYKKLLTQGVVSPVYVKSQYHGVTGDKNKLTLDDSTLQIANQPELLKNQKLWLPALAKGKS